jgi:hypothetical protein
MQTTKRLKKTDYSCLCAVEVVSPIVSKAFVPIGLRGRLGYKAHHHVPQNHNADIGCSVCKDGARPGVKTSHSGYFAAIR